MRILTYHYCHVKNKKEETKLIKYRHLDNLLKSNLKNLREYMIGGMAVYPFSVTLRYLLLINNWQW